MSLTASLRSATKAAISALGDLATTCTYNHRDQSGTYAPATGTVTNTDTTVSNVKVVVTDETRVEPGGQSKMQMSVAYIHSSELTTDPADGDWFTTADGRRWTVRKILANNEIVWELQVERRT